MCSKFWTNLLCFTSLVYLLTKQVVTQIYTSTPVLHECEGILKDAIVIKLIWKMYLKFLIVGERIRWDEMQMLLNLDKIWIFYYLQHWSNFRHPYWKVFSTFMWFHFHESKLYKRFSIKWFSALNRRMV